MNILIKGNKISAEELVLKLSATGSHQTTQIEQAVLPKTDLKNFDVIFDLDFDSTPENLTFYSTLNQTPVVVSAVKTQLAKAVAAISQPLNCTLIGMNTLPGFINTPLAEVSLFDVTQQAQLNQLMQQLNWPFKLVEDRVGLVTPRIIFMIINEACYTLQEGTASMMDIDTSMKLGTNYPFGPFEWADKIGISHVYETLKAMHEDTADPRYMICPLLKTKYLKQQTFY